jgi:uncharacterized membrane protein YgcG
MYMCVRAFLYAPHVACSRRERTGRGGISAKTRTNITELFDMIVRLIRKSGGPKKRPAAGGDAKGSGKSSGGGGCVVA